ncbi:hypothetical protein M2R47_08710 [Moraxella sp. Tifton1]|uniref:hypothetical protein n=1 Tax=Moraxella oculi TaxID=2940516 RepID=UPI002011A552|nr:hypothetical protein [Moraxella sp. Tifton1]MCL1624314.1 hypothetical protein [Moraxella sp. Tifton1]
MSKQPIAGKRDKVKQTDAEKKLIEFNIPPNSEFYNFYKNFFCGHIVCNVDASAKMCDILPPQGLDAAIYAHKNWDIPKNYILFTTGEGGGGYFYNIDDNSVWDCGLGEQHLLGTDQLKHWDSFYEFMVWYLTVDE